MNIGCQLEARQPCHSERSEESRSALSSFELLGFFAQNDMRLFVAQEAAQLPIAYSVGGFGTGGGRAWAFTSDSNPLCLWVPSQNGLFPDWPQRQSEIVVRPAKSKALPSASQIVISPSTRNDPFLFTVIFIKYSSHENVVGAALRALLWRPLRVLPGQLVLRA